MRLPAGILGRFVIVPRDIHPFTLRNTQILFHVSSRHGYLYLLASPVVDNAGVRRPIATHGWGGFNALLAVGVEDEVSVARTRVRADGVRAHVAAATGVLLALVDVVARLFVDLVESVTWIATANDTTVVVDDAFLMSEINAVAFKRQRTQNMQAATLLESAFT